MKGGGQSCGAYAFLNWDRRKVGLLLRQGPPPRAVRPSVAVADKIFPRNLWHEDDTATNLLAAHCKADQSVCLLTAAAFL